MATLQTFWFPAVATRQESAPVDVINPHTEKHFPHPGLSMEGGNCPRPPASQKGLGLPDSATTVATSRAPSPLNHCRSSSEGRGRGWAPPPSPTPFAQSPAPSRSTELPPSSPCPGASRGCQHPVVLSVKLRSVEVCCFHTEVLPTKVLVKTKP